ncbi:hypothetical protein [Ferribacterium limneticum]|uniref:hypothetical protein n=1 Tax=Ferribacterium limneticum TaxID=76259 RepID=UPI001CF9073C|nr:hypothetical protein [Ferribacterium limneticum]UCV26753.1 hypothetical protein KI617_10570 [Ferribacterium limneticum]UCV30670.1 hypothetical protein KI608_10570 [Ferribacterium limneticum]
MNFNQLINTLLQYLREHLQKQLDAPNLSVTFDKEGMCFHAHGQCRKVHPDLVAEYPNGWDFAQDYSLDEVLKKLNLKLELNPNDHP